jgi:hypothetical protein
VTSGESAKSKEEDLSMSASSQAFQVLHRLCSNVLEYTRYAPNNVTKTLLRTLKECSLTKSITGTIGKLRRFSFPCKRVQISPQSAAEQIFTCENVLTDRKPSEILQGTKAGSNMTFLGKQKTTLTSSTIPPLLIRRQSSDC